MAKKVTAKRNVSTNRNKIKKFKPTQIKGLSLGRKKQATVIKEKYAKLRKKAKQEFNATATEIFGERKRDAKGRLKQYTKNQKEYIRIVQRINKGGRAQESKGYKQIIDLPEPPQHITKKYLQNLKGITSSNLYGKDETPLKELTPQQKKLFEAPKPKRIRKKRRQYEHEEYGTDNYDNTSGYTPTFSIYEAIRERIVERIGEIGEIKNGIDPDYIFHLLSNCLDVLDNNHNANPSAYEDYLSDNEEAIAENIDIIARDSGSARVENSYTEILQLLCLNENYIQIQKGINTTENDDIDNPFLYE